MHPFSLSATVKYLHSSFFFGKKQRNPSDTLVIEVMMIPHINMTSLSTFNSKNLRTKEDTKNYFSKSTQKIDLIYLP